MKKVTLFTLLVFAASFTFAQKLQPGYLAISGGAAFFEEAPKGMGQISFGVSPSRTFGIGAGIGFVDIDKAYIPLTVDISYFGKPGKISPVVIGSAGHGIYKNTTPYFTIKGGFTGSLNVGVALPTKKYTKLLLTGGYSFYSFSGGQNVQATGYNYKFDSKMEAFTVRLGVKI